MGTSLRVVLYGEHQAQADRAVEAVYSRVDELISILSDYDPRSELRRLSAASGRRVPTELIAVSDDLWQVLQQSTVVSELSGGAFDVTVGPYVRLWRRARQQGKLPGQDRLTQARSSVGINKLRLHPTKHAVQLLAPKMLLDVGGIAKGYIVDEAIKVLRGQGIEHALVDAGGDIAVSDSPPGQPGWRVGLVFPDLAGKPGAGILDARNLETGNLETGYLEAGRRCFIWLHDQAVATSGNFYRYVEIAGQRYSHIIDPRSGIGLTHQLQVSVCAPDCMTADSLASAVSVLGVPRGLALINRIPETSARVCDLKAGGLRVHATSSFPKRWRVDIPAPEPANRED